MNYKKSVLFIFVLLSIVLLSACGNSNSLNSTDTLNAIYTSAAQTIVAQSIADTQPAIAQSLTPADTPTSSPTDLPTLVPLSPTASLFTTLSGDTCDGAVYVSDVTIPDGTVETAGQSFVKTWMLKNTGSCTWDANYTFTFISGTQMAGTNTPISGSIDPGQESEVSVTLTAPTAVGQYTGYWRLTNDSGEGFGETVDVVINVDDTATETPEDYTATPADIATYTETATSTTAPTSILTTAVPTSIPTTAVPTSVPTTAVPTSLPTTAVPTSVPTTAVPNTAVPTSSTPSN